MSKSGVLALEAWTLMLATATLPMTAKSHEPVLMIKGLSKSYDGVRALQDVSLCVGAASTVGIIGPNGAGKTTLFDVLTGLTRSDAGAAWLGGQPLRGMSLERLARLGVVRTFQDVLLPSELTVSDYLALAKAPGMFEGVLSNIVWRRKSKAWYSRERGAANAFLEDVGFRGRSESLCSELSLGEQKFVSVIRALWRRPKLLLLDEPTQNCSSGWIATLERLLGDLRDNGSAILVISHDQSFARRVSDRLLRMDSGELLRVDDKREVNTTARHNRFPTISHKELRPALLAVRDLEVSVNGFGVVKDMSLDVHCGDVIGIIGPNGAGKSSLLKGILGLLPRTKGTVTFEGLDITSLPPFAVAKRGVSLMLQGARLAPRLTVQDAIDLCWRDGNYSLDRSIVWEDLQSTRDLYLRFPAVSRRRSVHAGVLSAGEQQLLALMMSIARRPKLLLLDEPSVGLHPVVLHELFQWLGELANRGLGLVVVEQQVEALSTIATQMITVENGCAVSRTMK